MKIPSKRLFRSQFQISNLEYKHYTIDFREVLVSGLFANTCKLMNKELRDKVMIDHGSDVADFLDVTTFRFGAYVIPMDEVHDFISEIIGNMSFSEIRLIHFNQKKIKNRVK